MWGGNRNNESFSKQPRKIVDDKSKDLIGLKDVIVFPEIAYTIGQDGIFRAFGSKKIVDAAMQMTLNGSTLDGESFDMSGGVKVQAMAAGYNVCVILDQDLASKDGSLKLNPGNVLC